MDFTNNLSKKLEKQYAPTIRLVDRIGYDPISQSWIFGKFLYDKNGKRHQSNADGYFPKQAVRCRTEADFVADYSSNVNVQEMLQTMKNVYGNRGLLVTSYYTATLLKHRILQEEKAFPFLSIFGQKGSGKTTLVDFLNQCFFQNWQGIMASERSTAAALSRQFHRYSSLVIPFNESNGRFPRTFEEGRLLNAFHGGSLYDRAKYDNSNDIISLPFNAGLVFCQNHEPFSIGAVKERVINLQFLNAEEGGVTDGTREAMKRLIRYTPADRAALGHTIFSKIQELEKYLFENLPMMKEWLAKEGIESPTGVFYTRTITDGLPLDWRTILA